MQSVKTLILLAFLGLFGTDSRAQEKLYFESNQEKIHAIEQLWIERGIPHIIQQWVSDSVKREPVAELFKVEYAGKIEGDRREFFGFVNNPEVSYPELAAPKMWLENKQGEYALLLNQFLNPQNGGSPLTPSVQNWQPPDTVNGPYIPTPPLSSQCQFLDMDSTLWQWSTDTGLANGDPKPPLLGSYTPNIGTFKALSKIQSYDNPGLPYDPLVGGTALSKIYPGPYNHWSVKLENYQNGYGLSHISKKFTVDANKPWIEYRYAVVLQDPGDHDSLDRPFFEVKVTNSLGDSIPCSYYKVFAEPPMDGFAQVPGKTFYWRDWTRVVLPLDDYIGQVVTLHFTVGDCALGGHLGYAYIDGECLDDDLIVNTNCNPEQTITAPKGFDFYHWTGEEILGDNYRNVLKTGKAGTYKVDLITVTGCEVSREITLLNDCPDNTVPCTLSNASAVPSSCNSGSNTYSVSGQVTVGNISNGFLLVTAGNQSKIIPGPFSGPVSYQLFDLPANGGLVPISFKLFTSRHFSSYSLSCSLSMNFNAPTACGLVTFLCEDCIKGFAPEDDKKYVVSTWVKKDNASPLDYEYTDPFVKIGFYDGANWTYQTFYAAGEIIDGWQRISNEFDVPLGTEQVSIQLGTTSETAYFDDIRLYPADGSFKTFVYDPITLRLMAELDENNYATFYEYDEEGALIRIKKETERGIMTIQENRNYKVKKQ